MDIATQARVNELLLEREELLLRIHHLETRAAELLGEPWPFERPPLPSDARATKRKAPAPTRARDAAGAKPPALRPLSGPDDSWLVVYEQYGQRQEERHRDPAALATLFACQCATLRILSVT